MSRLTMNDEITILASLMTSSRRCEKLMKDTDDEELKQYWKNEIDEIEKVITKLESL